MRRLKPPSPELPELPRDPECEMAKFPELELPELLISLAIGESVKNRVSFMEYILG